MTVRTYHLNDYTSSTIRSLDTVWNTESDSDGIQPAFGLESLGTMGRSAFRLESRGTMGRFAERCEQMQVSTMSTVTTGNNNFENLIDRDNGERNLITESPDGDIDGGGLHYVSDNGLTDTRIYVETLAFIETLGGQLQSKLKIGRFKSKLIGSCGAKLQKLVERDDIDIGPRMNERYAPGDIFNFNRDVTTASLTRISERYEYDPMQMYNSATRLLLRGTMHKLRRIHPRRSKQRHCCQESWRNIFEEYRRKQLR